jgi:hypothetical protein
MPPSPRGRLAPERPFSPGEKGSGDEGRLGNEETHLCPIGSKFVPMAEVPRLNPPPQRVAREHGFLALSMGVTH